MKSRLTQAKELSPNELVRYARHIVLSEIGGSGQNKLKNARVAVIGAGGLGIPVMQYLNAAGAGEVTIVDHDVVSLPNLQRQVIFQESHVGLPKVEVARQVMAKQNSNTVIVPCQARFSAANARTTVEGCDVVIDGTDNFDTRILTNRTCLELNIPMVFGAISQWEGQVSVFRGQPCFECVFPVRPEGELQQTCSEYGVVSSLPGIIGSIMATEAIKLLTGAGNVLENRLYILDALQFEARMIRISPEKNCKACGDNRER